MKILSKALPPYPAHIQSLKNDGRDSGAHVQTTQVLSTK